MEKLCINAWKNYSVGTVKDKGMNDIPKKNVSSVTKGVTFAVSMLTSLVIGYICQCSLEWSVSQSKESHFPAIHKSQKQSNSLLDLTYFMVL